MMVGARAGPFARTSTMRARGESTKERWQGRRRSWLFQNPKQRHQNTVSLGALGGLQSWRRGWPGAWPWQLMVFWPFSPPAATALYPRRRAIAHTGDGRAHHASHSRLHLPAHAPTKPCPLSRAELNCRDLPLCGWPPLSRAELNHRNRY